MCESCGCGSAAGEKKVISVQESLLKANETAARDNRTIFDDHNLLAVNMISSPGSGKTTLLEKTIETLKGDISIGVLEGDIETDLDAERIRARGAPAVQLTTGGACHLDSPLVRKGLKALRQEPQGSNLDILFIENVGNLVCPSFFSLGEHLRVVLVSVAEGHDKPLKYPRAFQTAQIFIITKMDLLPHFDFDVDKATADALRLNPHLKAFALSAKTGEGCGPWTSFLQEETSRLNRARKRGS